MKEFLICTVYIETMTSLLKDSAISCYSYHPIPLIFCVSFNRSSTGFWSWVSLDQRDMSSVVQRRWMAGNSGKSYSFSQENLCWLVFIDHLGGGGGSEPLCNSGQSDQLPSLHHQSDEQECRWCHRPGQEERWAPTSLSIWRVLSISKPSGNIQGWITTMEEHSEAFDLVPLKLGIIFKPGQARQILWTGMHCSPAKNKNNNTASMTQLFLARQQTMTSWWLGSRIRARELQWNYICLF